MKLRQPPSGPVVALPGSAPEYANGNAPAGDKFIDWSHGPAQSVVLTGNATLQMYRGLTPGEPVWLQLAIRQGGAGGNVPVLQGVVTPGGTPLTFSTAAGALDLMSLYFDGGRLYATIAGLNFQ